MRLTFFALALCAACFCVQAGGPVPDFKLLDQNANSTRHLTEISPRDYLLRISAYYFGDAG